MTPQQLDAQMEKVFGQLARELSDVAPADEVTSVGLGHYERLRDGAAITDFIPLLVYRYTREELVTTSRDDLHRAA
jgi:hypothetical protein